MYPFAKIDGCHIGVGSKIQKKGANARFTNLKIRQLSEMPKDVEVLIGRKHRET